jgi:transcriptional regulator with XRE-family HTH domain
MTPKDIRTIPMRRSVERHVVAKIRMSLGLHQSEFAKRVGVATVTIKKVESLALPLSITLAGKIGEYYRVSPDYLLENKLDRKPVSSDGEPWTAKTFFRLRPPSLEDRFVDLLVTSRLFHNYRRCRGGLQRVKDLLVASFRLEELFDRAYAKFLKEYPEAAQGDHVTLRHVVADAEAHFRSKLPQEVVEDLLERDLSGHRL